MGAVFVEELDEVPDGRPVVFSAHGVPKVVPAAAEARGLDYLDATCPLVSKVHRQAQRLIEDGRHILFIGHAGHPEVIGTFGQVPEGSMTLVETVERCRSVSRSPTPPTSPSSPRRRCRSTTPRRSSPRCSARFPAIRAPRGEDICYATSNRQAAVKAIAPECERMLVIGAPNSSNSLRLVEVAERDGVPARLIQRAADIDWDWLGTPATVGITAGASAPECWCAKWSTRLASGSTVTEEESRACRRGMTFKLPRELVA